MRVYVATTGVLFALLAVLHVWRAVAESASLAHDPWYLVITLAAAALSIWAMVVLRRTAPR
ncbi:MAG TPA: hypothetical protein VF761_09495 [Gemmatimonadaceae bacterium]